MTMYYESLDLIRLDPVRSSGSGLLNPPGRFMYCLALLVVFLCTALALELGSSTCFPCVLLNPPKPRAPSSFASSGSIPASSGRDRSGRGGGGGAGAAAARWRFCSFPRRSRPRDSTGHACPVVETAEELIRQSVSEDPPVFTGSSP